MNTTCYLLAWLIEDRVNGTLVVDRVGLYSEAPWQITHDLRNDQPAIISQTHDERGYDYASRQMEQSIVAELKMAKRLNIRSVRRTILQMAANEINRWDNLRRGVMG